MKSRFLKLIPVSLALILALYLLFPRSVPAKPLPPASEAARAAASAANSFAFDLFAKLRGRPGNLCLSPYSIHAALTMTHEGAAGPTAAQLAAALHLDTAARAGQHDLHARLQAPGNHGFEFSVANRLWADRTAAILPAFRTRLAADFLADAQTVDFADPAAVSAINAWTSRQTRGHIPEILRPADVDRLTVLVLTNALYFKGNWDIPFKKSDTAEGDFLTAPGAKVRLPLMHQNKKHAYADRDAAGNVPAFRALSLNYTCGDLAMLFLLPELGQLDPLEAALNDQLLAAILNDLHDTWVPVTLPRFTITDSFSLPPALQSLGVTDAFDPKIADFSKLCAPSVYLTAVIHKTFLEVNEQGTEAAAATAVVGAGGVSLAPRPPDFKADHPFLFLLRDKSTGAILFFGRVSKP
jgi:serpin B